MGNRILILKRLTSLMKGKTEKKEMRRSLSMKRRVMMKIKKVRKVKRMNKVNKAKNRTNKVFHKWMKKKRMIKMLTSVLLV